MLFVENGAQVDKYGQTPLYLATINGSDTSVIAIFIGFHSLIIYLVEGEKKTIQNG